MPRFLVLSATVGLLLGSVGSSAGLAATVPTEAYLAFDGADDHVEIADAAALDLTSGALTLSAWIRPSGWGQNNQGRIFDHAGGSGPGWSLHLENKSSSGSPQTLRVQINDDGSFEGKADPGAILLDVWQHIAVTLAAGTLTFYVDGIERGSSSGVPTPLASSNPIRIGRRATDGNRAYAGEIDEARIWNRALSQAEIQAGMGTEIDPNDPDLIAYYRMNEGSGQTAFDLASGNDGRLGSTSGADGDDPLWVSSSNQAPVVDAGSDVTIMLPVDSVILDGLATDDGLPNNSLVTAWSVVSGPAGVSFDDPTAVDATATFPMEGAYVLRLTADDGELVGSDDVEITVEPPVVLSSLVVTPDPVTLSIGENVLFDTVALDEMGNPVVVTPLWTATAGMIDAAGFFTPDPSSGPVTITATVGAYSADATVFVVDPDEFWPTQGWATATPADLGMARVKLEQARDYALAGGGSGFVTRGGRLVMQWGNSTTTYAVRSATKSIGITVLGLALQDGVIALTDAAQTHLPGIGVPPDTNISTGWLDDIDVLQLATQTAGFDKPGGYIDLLFEPGTTWAYSDGGPNWLADVLTVIYGQDLETLMFDRVFTPMGIPSAELNWRSHVYREDLINGIKRREFGSGIGASVNALARIGYLYLRDGRWEGQQVIPQSFVAQAGTTVAGVEGLPVGNDTQSRFAGASDHYGFLWWNNADGSMADVPTDAFWAWGLGDHLIVVIPSLDIVVGRTGSAWAGLRSPSYYVVLAPFISPIARSVAGNSPDTDTDGDGFDDAADCDPLDPSVHPGAPELNDAKDNQCSGDSGYGLTDEIGESCGFHDPADTTRYSWLPQTGALLYEVLRSLEPDFSRDCVSNSTTADFWIDAEEPPPGRVFHYLVRPLTPNAGSWGRDSTPPERSPVCL